MSGEGGGEHKRARRGQWLFQKTLHRFQNWRLETRYRNAYTVCWGQAPLYLGCAIAVANAAQYRKGSRASKERRVADKAWSSSPARARCSQVAAFSRELESRFYYAFFAPLVLSSMRKRRVVPVEIPLDLEKWSMPTGRVVEHKSARVLKRSQNTHQPSNLATAYASRERTRGLSLETRRLVEDSELGFGEYASLGGPTVPSRGPWLRSTLSVVPIGARARRSRNNDDRIESEHFR